MKLSEFKTHLENITELHFVLPSHNEIPAHFHITEIGLVNKQFIDCGGTFRTESAVTFQLWTSTDFHHRLSTDKLLKIISTGEEKILKEDLEVEIEYQSDTIGKYGIEFKENKFYLTTKQTACLAQDHCGIPVMQKPQKSLSTLAESPCCTPGGGCC